MLSEDARVATTSNDNSVSATSSDGVSWHVYVLVAVAVVALFSRFLHGAGYWAYFEDDFFYYALVAKRLALTHLSSFDGIHLTNGYHPLWLLTLTVLYRVFPGISFFYAVQGVSLAATLVFYFAVLRCFAYFGVPATVRRAAALVLSLHALLLFRYGMEVTLALPLGFCMLAYVLNPKFRWSTRQTLIYGFLASLTILSRLDAIFLVLLLLVAQTVTSEVSWTARIRRVATFGVGAFLFPMYVATNLYVFHTLLPVSGMAKQLKPFFPPSMVPITNFLMHPDRAKAAFAYTAILVIVAGVYLFAREYRSRGHAENAVLTALFLFPVVHVGTMCLLSDWPLWPWYYYSLSFAVLGGIVVILRREKRNAEPARLSYRSALTVMYAVATLLAVYVGAYAIGKRPPAFATFGGFVADFSQTHPGTYAMGDCAGSAGYRSDSPLIQLEGLMMDKAYVQVLRAKTPLPEVLHTYHADYYATIENPVQRDGCFTVHEPNQAGPASPKMLGRICAQPLATVRVGSQSVGIFHASDVLNP